MIKYFNTHYFVGRKVLQYIYVSVKNKNKKNNKEDINY